MTLTGLPKKLALQASCFYMRALSYRHRTTLKACSGKQPARETPLAEGEGQIDLSDCTFLIPIRLESPDRRANLEIVLGYLSRHLHTQILVLEADRAPLCQAIAAEFPRVEYLFVEEDSSQFHRTRHLNTMLRRVQTSVAVNYDADVLLPVASYRSCYREVLQRGGDLVYPYRFDQKSVRNVNAAGRQRLATSLSLADLTAGDYATAVAECGYCQFFKRESYIEGGMENEEFISYGPEDRERTLRFLRLGFQVRWLDATLYHLEHFRSVNSSPENPYWWHNVRLYRRLTSMSNTALRDYYLMPEGSSR